MQKPLPLLTYMFLSGNRTPGFWLMLVISQVAFIEQTPHLQTTAFSELYRLVQLALELVTRVHPGWLVQPNCTLPPSFKEMAKRQTQTQNKRKQ